MSVGGADWGVEVEGFDSGDFLDLFDEDFEIMSCFCGHFYFLGEVWGEVFFVEFLSKVRFIEDGEDFFAGDFFEQSLAELVGGLAQVEDEQDDVGIGEEFEAFLLGEFFDVTFGGFGKLAVESCGIDESRGQRAYLAIGGDPVACCAGYFGDDGFCFSAEGV